MMGVSLFLGFLAGIGCCMAMIALLPGLMRLLDRPITPEPNPIRENRDLQRLQRQLDEIERYHGTKSKEGLQ